MQGHICRQTEFSRGTRNTWKRCRCGKTCGPWIAGRAEATQAAHRGSQLREARIGSVSIGAASALVPVCLYNVWVGGNCGVRHHQSDINTWWGLNEVQYCSTNIIISFFFSLCWSNVISLSFDLSADKCRTVLIAGHLQDNLRYHRGCQHLLKFIFIALPLCESACWYS